ncbi:MAG: M23 family metallopeptidase [Nitrospirota bacterium]|nr:M23 family metallopeptidase [Nitrospirota bacterium]
MKILVRLRALSVPIAALILAPCAALAWLRGAVPSLPLQAFHRGHIQMCTKPQSHPQELTEAWLALQREAKEALDIGLPSEPAEPPKPLWGGVIINAVNPLVLAGASGRPIYIGFVNGLGYVVVLDHGNRTYTIYGLLKEVLIHNLERVAKGQAIGLAHTEPERRLYATYFAVQKETTR